MHFAEAGRSCTEFWLSKCIDAGCKDEVHLDHLLDMISLQPRRKTLYGYHRPDDPKVLSKR